MQENQEHKNSYYIATNKNTGLYYIIQRQANTYNHKVIDIFDKYEKALKKLLKLSKKN